MRKADTFLDPTSEPRFSVRLCMFLGLVYTAWRMTYTPCLAGPPILEIKTEKQLDETLNSGNFGVIGVYNSKICPKCLTYFLKWSHGLVKSPLAVHFNLTLHLIDQYSFRNARGSFEKPLYATPALFFLSRPDLLFFNNFSAEANLENYWGNTFRRMEAATTEFWNDNLPKLIQINSFDHLWQEIEVQKMLVLFMGSQGNVFGNFVNVATHNFQRTFAFITDPNLVAEIVMFFQGFLPVKGFYMAVLRHNSLLTRVDNLPFVVIEPFTDENDLDRLIRLECLPRISRNKDTKLFIQNLLDRLPVFAYVEAPDQDPLREQNQTELVEFLISHKKLAHTSILSAKSHLRENPLFRAMFSTGKEDLLYAVINIGEERNINLRIFPYRGQFSSSGLHHFYHTYITTRQVMSVGFTKLSRPLEKETLQMFKSIILGRIIKNTQSETSAQ